VPAQVTERDRFLVVFGEEFFQLFNGQNSLHFMLTFYVRNSGNDRRRDIAMSLSIPKMK
jgi:hypothetical protein